MKKNYVSPETKVIKVAATQMICGSMTISNDDTTSSQWSRDGGCWDEDDE